MLNIVQNKRTVTIINKKNISRFIVDGVLEIPDTVQTIESFAGEGNEKIHTVKIPNSVKEIGENAFYKSSVQNIIFEKRYMNSMLKIKKAAFAMTKVRSVTLTDVSLEVCAFYGCQELTEIIFDGKIEAIPDSCFENTGILSITIPKQITSIGIRAFAKCNSLKSIYLYGGTQFLGQGCFVDNPELEQIITYEIIETIPDKMLKNCSNLKKAFFVRVNHIGSEAFMNCTSLEEFNIYHENSNGFLGLEISNSAFYNCKALRNLKIKHAEIRKVGEKAFKECFKLRKIDLQHVETIGNEAFKSCKNLREIGNLIKVTTIGDYAFQSCESLDAVTFGNEINSIGKYAFSNCNKLESIILPSSLISLEDGAFNGCICLKNVEINSTELEYLPNAVFDNCKSLQTFKLANNCEITHIGTYAFRGCIALQNFTIFKTVRKIGIEAFANCRALTDITFETTYLSIAEQAFMGCENIKQIKMDGMLESLGTCAFAKCRNLEKIEIPFPEDMKTNCFSGCDKLKTIEFTNR